MNDTKAIADWLIDGARSAANTQDMLAQFCDRLLGCGIPIWRVGLFIFTLHPQVMGQRVLWKPDAPVAVDNASFEMFQSEDFRRSPVRHVIDTGVALRRRLVEAVCPLDFALTRDLKAQGVTDYFVVPLVFADGVVHAASFATQHPAGFADRQIAGIEQLVAPLTRVIESRMLKRTAIILLDTYVGNQAGARVLAGHIRRGDTDVISAAIWLSDMRGFTRLADRLPPQALTDLLNRYFDCQVPAIQKHGGEILKYMGDGLLAIFAIATEGPDEHAVCHAALAAAYETRTAVATAFSTAEGLSDYGLNFGLALHVGELLYGNIGSGNRLDFTCIGPAVNLAARIEKLTGESQRTILASHEFARHFPSQFASIGEFALRGFGTARPVFGLTDEAAPRA